MAYTRRAIRLKWASGTKQYAFYIKQQNFTPQEAKPAQYRRNLSGRLLRVFAPTYRKVMGIFLVRDSATDTLDGVPEGDISKLKEAHAATDLQVQSFGDSAYWNAEWMGDWPPVLDYDPLANLISVPVILEERLDS